MAGSNLKLTHETLTDGIIVTLSGDLTAAADGEFVALASSPEWPKAILLDFTSVDYINSGGIALLIGLLRSARTNACTMRARGLSEHYRKIFRMVGLNEYIDILPD